MTDFELKELVTSLDELINKNISYQEELKKMYKENKVEIPDGNLGYLEALNDINIIFKKYKDESKEKNIKPSVVVPKNTNQEPTHDLPIITSTAIQKEHISNMNLDKLKNILAFLSILFGEDIGLNRVLMEMNPHYLIEKWEKYVESIHIEHPWGVHTSLRHTYFDRYFNKWKEELKTLR